MNWGNNVYVYFKFQYHHRWQTIFVWLIWINMNEFLRGSQCVLTSNATCTTYAHKIAILSLYHIQWHTIFVLFFTIVALHGKLYGVIIGPLKLHFPRFFYSFAERQFQSFALYLLHKFRAKIKIKMLWMIYLVLKYQVLYIWLGSFSTFC